MKRYDQEFKRDAVTMLINSGKPLKQVAKELGVGDAGLRGLLSKTLCQEVIGREFGFETLLKHTDQNGAMIKDHGVWSGPFTMG